MPHVSLYQLYDVKNNITLNLQIESHSTGEREMALKHLNKTETGDLAVYDRSYPFVWFYKYHRLKMLISLVLRSLFNDVEKIKNRNYNYVYNELYFTYLR
jgi:hypothetical protein